MRYVTIALASLALAAPASAVIHNPTIVVDRSNAVVRGSSFKPTEMVRVVLYGADAPWSKSLRATATGTFRVSLRGVSLPRCSSYVVKVTGDRGSKASLTIRPPECSSQ